MLLSCALWINLVWGGAANVFMSAWQNNTVDGRVMRLYKQKWMQINSTKGDDKCVGFIFDNACWPLHPIKITKIFCSTTAETMSRLCYIRAARISQWIHQQENSLTTIHNWSIITTKMTNICWFQLLKCKNLLITLSFMTQCKDKILA